MHTHLYHPEAMMSWVLWSDIVFVLLLSVDGLTYTATRGDLESIPDDIPSDVTSIILTDNNLRGIPDHAFSDFVKLEHLDLTNNKISKISPTAFQGTQLSYLDLGNNLLEEIPDLTEVSNSLEELYMGHNALTTIESLHMLTTLTHLYVPGNQIAKLTKDSLLSSASTIEAIQFDYNHIEYVDRDFFSKMSSLRSFSIQHNNLGKFLDFSRLPMDNSLEDLQMTNTGIEFISKSQLKQLTQLRFLSLSYNQLEELPDFIYQSESLQKLYLNENSITKLKSDAFDGMTQLEELDMSWNGLHDISAIYAVTTMESLYLSENNLGYLTADDILNLFRTMPQLTSLALDSTGLTTYPDIRQFGRSFRYIAALNPESMICDSRLCWLKDGEELDAQSFDWNDDSYACWDPEILGYKTWGTIMIDDLCSGDVSTSINGKLRLPRGADGKSAPPPRTPDGFTTPHGKRNTSPNPPKPKDDDTTLTIIIVVVIIIIIIIIGVSVGCICYRRRRQPDPQHQGETTEQEDYNQLEQGSNITNPNYTQLRKPPKVPEPVADNQGNENTIVKSNDEDVYEEIDNEYLEVK